VDATLIAYTDKSAFDAGVAALSGTTQILNFDNLSDGFLIKDGDTVGGITFNYDFGGVEMMVSNEFDTTSSPNFLGTNDADVFQDGDSFDLSFSPINAIGMYFITTDELWDNDITLKVGTFEVPLVSADEQGLLSNDYVFFLGVIDDMNTFSSASVVADSGEPSPVFLYNVDDITTAETMPIPEPSSFILFMIGILMMGAFIWHWKRKMIT